MRAASGRQVAISTFICRLLMVWAPHHTVLPHYKTVNICPNTDIAHTIVRPWDWSMVYLWWVHGVVYSLSLELQHCTLTRSITDNSIRILDFVRYNLFIFVQCNYYEIAIDCINHILSGIQWTLMSKRFAQLPSNVLCPPVYAGIVQIFWQMGPGDFKLYAQWPRGSLRALMILQPH